MDSTEQEDFGTQTSGNASTQTLGANGDSAASKPLRRACDCCRKRKVKCDGGEPCGPCKKATIRCAYLQPPKKKGPKGLRSARVLHALRRIDDTVSGAPTSPLSPEHPAFGNWDWNQPNNTPNGIQYPEQMAQQQHDVMYGPHTSVPPDQTYFTHMPTSMPTAQPQQYPQDPYGSAWKLETMSSGSDIPTLLSPTISATLSDVSLPRLPGECFTPYIELFFAHMFPIMPIIDRRVYLDPTYYTNSALWTAQEYCFLCSICAATIVQLDDSIPKPPAIYPGKPTDDVFAEACIRERKHFDYVGRLSTLSIMTSFFMFAYYGNHTQQGKAWYYLQEAITFSETLGLDQEEKYEHRDPVEAQWRRRLYWLLFITERAYAVQCQKHTRLTPSIQLPEIFDSEDPILIGGFVSLANLFSAVDDNFVRAWRGSRKASLCNEAWFLQTQERLDKAALAIGHISETQHLDIGVTKEWLHVLTWQVGIRNGLIRANAEGGMRFDYPIELAKKVVDITSGANALALDSHGIGMEQKLSDIAHCLADVLDLTKGDTSETWFNGREYLGVLLQRLSSMRGKQSAYLKPLETKAVKLLGGWTLNNTMTMPLPVETSASYSLPFQTVHATEQWHTNPTPRMSLTDYHYNALRSLSMSGNLGGMALAVGPIENWGQRRESGKVLETDTDDINDLDWYMNAGVPQAV